MFVASVLNDYPLLEPEDSNEKGAHFAELGVRLHDNIEDYEQRVIQPSNIPKQVEQAIRLASCHQRDFFGACAEDYSSERAKGVFYIFSFICQHCAAVCIAFLEFAVLPVP